MRRIGLGLKLASFLSAMVLLLAAHPADRAATQAVITVPADSPTIQGAIDAAADGDTVVVAPGTYYENVSFKGKAIEVRSAQGAAVTTIDGNSQDPVVQFGGEGPGSILRGFTIRHGAATTSSHSYTLDGGGISIHTGSPKILDNIITDNAACDGGGGIYASFGAPVIQGNEVSHNTQSGCSGGVGGGGIAVGGSGAAVVVHNTISDNFWGSAGGGITLFAAGNPVVEDNVIQRNTAYGQGGGMWIVNRSDALIAQNLIVGNLAQAGAGVYWTVPSGARGPLVVNNTVAGDAGSSLVFSGGFDAQTQVVNNIVAAGSGVGLRCEFMPPLMSHNNVSSARARAYLCSDLTGIDGNISADPQFVDPAAGNYHLRYGSPSVDAGDNSAPDLPSTDIEGAPRILDGNGDGNAVVDQGAYEVTTPAPPQGLRVYRIGERAVVVWQAPASGGIPVTGYVVGMSPGDASVAIEAPASSATFLHVKRNQAYAFTVTAVNQAGTSEPVSIALPRFRGRSP